MAPVRLAVVGTGKIAHDQRLPAIVRSAAFTLAATEGPDDPAIDGTPHCRTLAALLDDGPTVDAVVVCTPLQVRYDLAVLALSRGPHALLEKPPGATLAEVAALVDQSRRQGLTLFAGWHSRFAAGVEPAAAWLADQARAPDTVRKAILTA